MARLRILLTCTTLARRSGSEAYTRDLAVGLLRLGHAPVVYSTEMGEMAHEIKMATVPVVDDLARLSVPPDVIHGNHHLELMTALLQFPGVPGLHVCHAWNSIEASPPRFPRILRYVAVDETSRDRLLLEDGVPAGRVRMHFNSVDLDRFRPRGPLPPKPLRALVFSNYASEHTHLPAVREACDRAGIALDAIGAGVGNSVARPEAVLGGYDLVFAKARSALESMAVGTAVLLCDSTGVGPMVTAAELDALRQANFEIRTLRHPLDAEVLAREIARYDPDDAAEVSRRVRATAGLDEAAEEMVDIYQELIGEHSGASADREEEERAAAGYLRWLDVTSREARHALTTRAGQAEADRDRLSGEVWQLRAHQEVLEKRLGTTEAEREALRAEATYVTQSATWRLRNRLARWKPLMGAYMLLRRSRR